MENLKGLFIDKILLLFNSVCLFKCLWLLDVSFYSKSTCVLNQIDLFNASEYIIFLYSFSEILDQL